MNECENDETDEIELTREEYVVRRLLHACETALSVIGAEPIDPSGSLTEKESERLHTTLYLASTIKQVRELMGWTDDQEAGETKVIDDDGEAD